MVFTDYELYLAVCFSPIVVRSLQTRVLTDFTLWTVLLLCFRSWLVYLENVTVDDVFWNKMILNLFYVDVVCMRVYCLVVSNWCALVYELLLYELLWFCEWILVRLLENDWWGILTSDDPEFVVVDLYFSLCHCVYSLGLAAINQLKPLSVCTMNCFSQVFWS